MRLFSFKSIVGCVMVFVLATSLMMEQCQAIRVHAVVTPATSAADASGFARRLATDGSVEPTPDQAASRIYENMEKVGSDNKRDSEFGSSTTASDAVERQLCASVTVPIAACSGRRHFY